MKIQKVLTVSASVLLAILVVQIGVRYYSNPNGVRLFAQWRNVPGSAQEATKLADEVVQGRVIRVRQAEDLVVKIEGEPNGEDRIPIEVVTFKVSKNYKGKKNKDSTIEIFHVGGFSSPLSKRRPPMSQAPPKPTGGVDRSQAPRRPSNEELRPYSLDGDPEYKVGEKYLLFVRKGPEVKVNGRSTQTYATISPTTRFRIRANNRLETVTKNGFAPRFKGRSLRNLESKIPPRNRN